MSPSAIGTAEKAWHQLETLENSYFLKRIFWPSELFDQYLPLIDLDVEGPVTLIILLGKSSCDACADHLTAFASIMARRNLEVLAIVHASRSRYHQQHLRLNRVTFPVIWDKYRYFAKVNAIKHIPAALLVRGETILRAFFPLPTLFDRNTQFYATVSARFPEQASPFY